MMYQGSLAIRVIFFCCLFNPAIVMAENLSNVWLRYTEDEFHAKDNRVEASIALDENNSLIARAAETVTPVFNRVMSTNEYYLGLDSFTPYPWNIETGISYWGKSREMQVRGLHFIANWSSLDWSLGLDLEYREIDLYTRELPSGQLRYEASSIAAGPLIQYFHENLSLALFGKWYDYDELSRLQTFYTTYPLLALRRFGIKNRLHTGSLVDWYAGMSLQLTSGPAWFGMNYSHSVSVLDQSASDDVSLVYGSRLGDILMLEFELGRTFLEQGADVDYVSAGIGFNF